MKISSITFSNKKSQQKDILRRTVSGQGFAFAKPWDALCSQRLKTQSVLPPGAGGNLRFTKARL
ncbi:hypothetical protein [Youxingia wuxianensis]|uniref:Uncharacterized protein n=1 Tax=Youxingia wuxianensis TaxID=2763678 RepID=A0A926ELH4_9FIRM|nr:hypothetical protein [Youxingia wuxianensis]MBC8584570.1 hypothetical protein [Youxingia wuxianensis]